MPTTLPTPDQLAGSGLQHPGLAAVLLAIYQTNANIHREIVRLGWFEFALQCTRRNELGLSSRDYRWVFDELVRTKPPEISEMVDGTILDDRGHIVPPTRDDLRTAQAMGVFRARQVRIFLG